MGTTSSKPTVSMPGSFPSEVDERQAKGAEQEAEHQTITSEAEKADHNDVQPYDTSSTTPPVCNTPTPTTSVDSDDQAQQDNTTHEEILHYLWAARTLYRGTSRGSQLNLEGFLMGYYGLEKCCDTKALHGEYFSLEPEPANLPEVREAAAPTLEDLKARIERSRAEALVRAAEAKLRQVDEDKARDLRRLMRKCFVPSGAA
ncbi:hypothetical protein LTR37_019595 [Vermiconidia calcicola]|uniref:Uncharacterized protein n=1 Tax=Vermiconidia calcicola TaxID=1690605 RepID=A0ACC3MDU9_9PEZI|nr:hypothetical protein LTR37_019595 [Vermiconidia calcicola]